MCALTRPERSTLVPGTNTRMQTRTARPMHCSETPPCNPHVSNGIAFAVLTSIRPICLILHHPCIQLAVAAWIIWPCLARSVQTFSHDSRLAALWAALREISFVLQTQHFAKWSGAKETWSKLHEAYCRKPPGGLASFSLARLPHVLLSHPPSACAFMLLGPPACGLMCYGTCFEGYYVASHKDAFKEEWSHVGGGFQTRVSTYTTTQPKSDGNSSSC